MINAIFFDFDGVLTPDKTGSYTICTYISKATGIDFDKFSLAYRKYNNDLLYGKTTHEYIWKTLCSGIEIDIRHLHDSFVNTPINWPVFELAKHLKKKYKTGIITDNKADRISVIAEKYELGKYFDTIVVSTSVGSGKGDEKIFRKAVDSAGVSYIESVFYR